MTLLSPGDRFPALTFNLTNGDTIDLPDALSGSYGVVLFYRGSWCPYCNTQLRVPASTAAPRAGRRACRRRIGRRRADD